MPEDAPRAEVEIALVYAAIREWSEAVKWQERAAMVADADHIDAGGIPRAP